MTRPDRKLARNAAPAVEPITLTEAKTYLRIDGSTEDAIVTDMMKAVRLAAEEAMHRSLITQSWKMVYAGCLQGVVPLPYGVVQQVTSVTVYDEAGNDTVVADTAYHLDPSGDRLVLGGVVSGHRIEVVYVAGYGDAASDVPADIRQGMLLHLLKLYETRDTLSAPEAALQAYAPYVLVRL